MKRLWIKICGLTSGAAIEAAAAAGADAVGFVFHAESPRNLSIDEARALQDAVPPGVERVAVFLYPLQALVEAVIDAIRPDRIQTDAGDLALLRFPSGQLVLPVVRGGARLPQPLPSRLLLEGARSGAGERADWSHAAMVARRTQLVLAGGLDASNVADAVRVVRPFGVDVSSGVESARGVKDLGRIREFIGAARKADQAPVVEESR
ncbi:MAG: phosphoribosylanthranilate isomerase [Steroidobacteraceae bacterium]|nr:phosphoribosylanthranilate isomerase [Steroidobacteraceae bacterium]